MSRTCMRYKTQSKMATAELEYVPKGKDGLQPLLGILSNSKAPKSVLKLCSKILWGNLEF